MSRRGALVVLAAWLVGCRAMVSVSPTTAPTAEPTPTAEAVPTAEPTPTAELIPTAIATKSPAPAERVYVPPDDGLTRVVVDGEAGDWQTYPTAVTDPVGDSKGNVDVSRVYAVSNDAYLYVMFEVTGEIGSYAQLDVLINPAPSGADGWPPEYVLTAWPFEEDRPVELARVDERERLVVLDVRGQAAQSSVAEVRVPLRGFDGSPPSALRLRVMDGECCGDDWVTVDETREATVLVTREREPTFDELADLDALSSVMCLEGAVAEPAALEPAEDVEVSEGFTAEHFVAPSGLNGPSDLVVMPDGEMLVASSGSGEVLAVQAGGTITLYAQAAVVALDVDEGGTLYGYDSASGQVVRILEGGRPRIIARVPQTARESVMAVAPEGTIYVGLNLSDREKIGTASLYVIRAGGGAPRRVIDEIDGELRALDVAPDGGLLAVVDATLRVVDTESWEQSLVTRLPEPGSTHGLVATEDGTSYVSSGGLAWGGKLYRVAPDGQVTLVASVDRNGLQGLAVTGNGEVVGAQRVIGGLAAVRADGSVRMVVEPNGLASPEALAVSPCGELLAVSRLGGRVALVSLGGSAVPFVKVASGRPPETFVAFARSGWFAVGESAPGYEPMLKGYLPSGAGRILLADVGDVSGVAVAEDGSVYVAATGDGQILRVAQDGSREVVADRVRTPQGLVLAPGDVLFAVTGGRRGTGVSALPSSGDTVVMIGPDGSQIRLASVPGASALALGPDGWLYVGKDDGVVERLAATGEKETFASGFGSARGLAFDVAGNLYVADGPENRIVRIRGFVQGELLGRVTDEETGEAVAEARVRVTQVYPPFAGRLVISGDDGSFGLIAALGAYRVNVMAGGYYDGVEPEVYLGEKPQEVIVSLRPTGD